MRRNSAFTLIELLVVIAIIALLVSIIMPSLNTAKELAKTSKCLANMRNMELAHWMYVTANDGKLIQAGLGHGGAHANEDTAWINTLQDYYGSQLISRCPADDSPHWPGGTPVSSGSEQYRRCSYGINEYTDVELSPLEENPYDGIDKYPNPASIVHFVEMAEDGEYAGADHPHVYLWIGNVLSKASNQLQIDQHGGEPMSWTARANYGFLDGHAETCEFKKVFTSQSDNKFNPDVAK